MTEREKVAYSKGWEMAWDHKINGRPKPENPYIISKQYDLYDAWQQGYDDIIHYILKDI